MTGNPVGRSVSTIEVAEGHTGVEDVVEWDFYKEKILDLKRSCQVASLL